MVDRTPPPEKAKAQLEFRLEADDTVTIVVYDPIAFDNYKPEEEGVLAIIEKLDPSSELITLISVLLSFGAYFPSVKKIVDARTGRVMDVSNRDFSKGGVSRTWDKAHIKEVYEEKLARGIFTEDEFSFEDFEKEFRENNR